MRNANIFSEREFQRQVLQLARRSAPGFPDLVLVRPPRLLFVELNTATRRLRPEQCEWLDALAECSSAPEVHLWRTSSWNEIEATLARRSPLASSFVRNLNMGA